MQVSLNSRLYKTAHILLFYLMNDKSQAKCIFCLRSNTTFLKEAHIIPESAGNEKLTLPNGYECDECNEGFSKTEQQVLRSFPGQFFRVAFVDKTKRGRSPTSDIKGGKIMRASTPERPIIQIKQHSRNPNSGKFEIGESGSEITWESQNLSGRKVSALLAKMALEYLCLRKINVYTTDYDHLRDCAKSHGRSPFIPFFIGLHVEPTQAIDLISDDEICAGFKPVWIRFPGFSAVIPTGKSLENSMLDLFRSYIVREVPGSFMFISDPNWEKPIKVSVTLTPASQIARESYNRLLKKMKNQKT
jgi:hypothetical protein